MAVIKYKTTDGAYKELMNYNIKNVPIVQGTGTSTDSVMSQNAVTEELKKYVEKPATGEYATQKWVEDQEYLTDESLENYAEKATTLAGYGITDAKIEGNIITLGGNSITPLTEHQSLENYATKDTASGSKNGLMSIADYNYLQYLNGIATGTNISSVPTTKHIAIVTVSGGGSFGVTGMTSGRELHVIVKNSSSSKIDIAIPTSYSSNINNISIEGGKYGEINVIYDGSTYYVRAV